MRCALQVVDHPLEFYLERYDGFLLDAYGVLVDSARLLPGAAAFLRDLDASSKFAVVTNDSSRLPETISSRWAERGLKVDPERILTSGLVMQAHLADRYAGRRAAVLGTQDAREYVRRAGLSLVDATEPFDVFVLADEMGFDFLEGCNVAVTGLLREVRSGRVPAMVLPNPDVLYPAGEGAFGFAAGGVAAMFERALGTFLGDEAPGFEALGKPGAAILEAGRHVLGASKPLMVGDQLGTDILAANRAGFDSAILLSDLPPAPGVEASPTYAWRTLPTISR